MPKENLPTESVTAPTPAPKDMKSAFLALCKLCGGNRKADALKSTVDSGMANVEGAKSLAKALCDELSGTNVDKDIEAARQAVLAFLK